MNSKQQQQQQSDNSELLKEEMPLSFHYQAQGTSETIRTYGSTENESSSSEDEDDWGPCNIVVNDDELSSDLTKDSPSYSHTASTIALCLCTLGRSYLLVSVFPYAGFLAIDLIPGVDEENAGSYAGLIAAMFMMGRTFSSYAWGKIADTYGRTFVLYVSLISSCIFTLLFGLAPSFGMALFWRFCLGLGNGMVGTAKTAVTELARGNERVEANAMGLVMGMWGLGFLVSPALSGVLAEPVHQYADFWNYTCDVGTTTASACGLAREFLTEYPFFLPNLVGAMVCLTALTGVRFFVPETLPEKQRRSFRHVPEDALSAVVNGCQTVGNAFRTRVLGTKDASYDYEVLPLKNNADDDDDKQQNSATIASLWSRQDTRRHLMVYWAASLVFASLDEVFPLFCMSQAAGLGLAENAIGKILSLSGLIFAIFQFPIYALFVHKMGVYGSIRLGLMVAMPLIFFIPATVFFSTDNNLTWSALMYAGSLFGIYRIFGLVFFSNITIATNRTVPANYRATMNGLSMLGGSAVKAAGPLLGGCLFAVSASSDMLPTAAAMVLPFAMVGALGVLAACSSFTLSSGETDAEEAQAELTV